MFFDMHYIFLFIKLSVKEKFLMSIFLCVYFQIEKFLNISKACKTSNPVAFVDKKTPKLETLRRG